ncbi:unnamed protein product [Durusdinium trenchii]|uniref:Uncharacterized protein n=1 Tax=Durusdinium trenchii TaxID=1381693 RepID=A0ABP0L7L1_9DINO
MAAVTACQTFMRFRSPKPNLVLRLHLLRGWTGDWRGATGCGSATARRIQRSVTG